MKTMKEYAEEFKKKNKGEVTDVTDYSFKHKFTQKNGQTCEHVYMLSWFVSLK